MFCEAGRREFGGRDCLHTFSFQGGLSQKVCRHSYSEHKTLQLQYFFSESELELHNSNFELTEDSSMQETF